MSGRLIILPKKSWHPGKRENIEKVLRDERLAEEEAVAARERAREIAQEGVVETLSRKRSSAEKREGQAQVEEKPAGRKRKRPGKGKDAELLGGEGQGWGATLQHVNLFSEAEREAGKLLGQNADHQREKQEQDLKAQQRSGLAPTALGEGAAELKDKDSQPWYTQVEASSRAPKVAARAVRLGREVTGEEAEAVMKRDDGRKARADPLSSLFRSAAQPAARILPQERMGTSLKPRPSVATSLGEDAGKSEGATARSESDKRSKKSKKDKKDKKHKKKSSKRRRGSSDRDNSRTRGDAAAEAGGSGGDAGSAAELTRRQALEDLRRRRLAREGGERERQIRLLAEREMAGQSLPDERSMAYNNQYNAPVARQNRIR